jgi:8-oxo-dGTP pyrophosphatase MutT (NUDIX family)
LAAFDPQELPIDSIAGEAGLLPERLQPDWLRARFASPPLWTPEINQEQLLRQTDSALRPAAVLIPIVLHESGSTLLLTRRNTDLRDHPGQISFPGGRMELYDLSPIDTALRETEEEIGLARHHVEVIGSLPQYLTGTGYRVTPVAALVTPPFQVVPDPGEVAEVFEVPLNFLMDGRHHQRRTVELPGGVGQRTFYTMPYDRYFIWGATAGMLRNLFHFLRT